MTKVMSRLSRRTGDLEISPDLGEDDGVDTGVTMVPGTSPSIDDNDDVAFQGSNGDLWIWIQPALEWHPALTILAWG